MKQNFVSLFYLTRRNVKLYFLDRMTFFVSLITPLILLVLFATFLKRTYEDTILATIAPMTMDRKLLDAFTGGWLFSSVLSTSCVTVSFCSGTMTLDKINHVDVDFRVSPAKPIVIQIGYVLANYLATLCVCLVLLLIGLVYLAVVGFYLSAIDVLMVVANVLLTSLFATLIANVLWTFSKSQGVVSGVCTLLSALYGFLCGAYMPIDSMGEAFHVFTGFLPGTYSTVLFRKAFLEGTLSEMSVILPGEAVSGIAGGFDVNYDFFGRDVSIAMLFLVGILSVIVGFGLLFLATFLKKKCLSD